MLYSSHILMTYREDVGQYVQASDNTVYNLLAEIHELFRQHDCAGGKYLWFKQFHFGDDAVWDAFGSEEDFFFAKIKDNLTEYDGMCSIDKFPLLVQRKTSSTATFW